MKKGFFNLPQAQSKKVQGRLPSCATCGLYQTVLSPKMEPFGNFKRGILNIGEAPGEMEDKRGKQWQGQVGMLLQKTYEKLGIDLFEDCLNINAINCRPTKNGGNRPPSPHEVACCRQRVSRVIAEHKPKVIVILGNQALISIMGHRWKKDLGKITKWRGWTIPDRDYNAWICPTFHPSYVARTIGFTNKGKEVETIWKQDLERAINLEAMPEYEGEAKHVEIITDLSILNDVRRSGRNTMVAIDYETTGLKPHAEGHKIICASVAVAENKCFAFMMSGDVTPFTKLLRSSNISKVAHNMKFEEAWSEVYLKTPVNNWVWDTMLTAHMLDNRTGVTGLKFQTYVNFGVMGYDDSIAPYLKAVDKKNSNTHNRILELIKTPNGKEQLLTYCGLDSLFTYRLALKQRMELK